MYNNDKAFKELVNCYHEIGLLLRKCDSITALGKICPATVNTRWVYIFDVLKFIDDNGTCEGYSSKKRERKMLENLDELRDFVIILEPLKALVVYLSSSSVNISDVYPAIREAVHMWESYTPDASMRPRIQEKHRMMVDAMVAELISLTVDSFEGTILIASYGLSFEGRDEIWHDSVGEDWEISRRLPDVLGRGEYQEDDEIDINEDVGNESLDEHMNTIASDTLVESDQLTQGGTDTNPVISQLLTKGDQDCDFFDSSQLYRLARRGICRFMKLQGVGSQTILQALKGFERWTRARPEAVEFRDLDSYGGLRAWERCCRAFASDPEFCAISESAACLQSIAASEVSCERMISRQGFIYNGRNHNMGSDLFQARLILAYKHARSTRP